MNTPVSLPDSTEPWRSVFYDPEDDLWLCSHLEDGHEFHDGDALILAEQPEWGRWAAEKNNAGVWEWVEQPAYSTEEPSFF